MLFSHAGSLVEVDLKSGHMKPVGRPRFHALADMAVCERRYQRNGQAVLKQISRQLIDPILGAPEAFFAPLVRVVTHPFLRRDGSWCSQHGYDQASQIFAALAPGPEPQRVPPPEASVQLRSLLETFSFQDLSSLAYALALCIRPLVQERIQGPSPETVITANAKDSGKTYLANCALLLSTGKRPLLIPPGSSPAEATYKADSVLQHQPPAVLYDNVATGATMGGAERHAMLTATESITVRAVGTSGTRVEPRLVIFIATLNQADFDDEHARRSVLIQLGPRRATYELPDLEAHIRAHSGWFTSALMSVVQDWLDAGAPRAPQRLSSFDQWSDVLGGIICHTWPDLADHWLSPRQRPIPALDRDWAALFSSWATSNPVALRPAQILAEVREGDLLALLELVGHRGPSSQQARLGRELAALAASGRPVGGWLLRRRRSGNNSFYYLEGKEVPDVR